MSHTVIIIPFATESQKTTSKNNEKVGSKSAMGKITRKIPFFFSIGSAIQIRNMRRISLILLASLYLQVHAFLQPSFPTYSTYSDSHNNLASSRDFIKPSLPSHSPSLKRTITTALKVYRGSSLSQPVLPSTRYIRIRNISDSLSPLDGIISDTFLLETSVVTFEKYLPEKKERVTVDLHSQVHFGDSSYFEYYNNRKQFSEKYDRIHFELIVGEDLLTTSFFPEEENGEGLIRSLLVPKNGIMPPAYDSQTASKYNFKCQVDVVDYSQPNWVCADLSREEFYRLQEEASKRKLNKNAPIWSSFSTPGSELFSAFVRPTTPTQAVSSSSTRTGSSQRLFTNLFLQGEGFASFLRFLLWIFIPAPEVNVMLLDWSTSFSPKAGSFVSPIAKPVFQSLFQGQFQKASKLIFSQLLVSGQAAASKENDLLIEGRNDHALNVLMHSIEKGNCKSTALLYGGLHCKDLQDKLTKRYGFTKTKTTWRTAWKIPMEKENEIIKENPNLNEATVAASNTSGNGDTQFYTFGALVAIPLYLTIDGLDFVGSWLDIQSSLQVGAYLDMALASVLYIFRHVALYLGLAKFVVEWDVGLFGETR